jgi:hypothetical protein
MLGRVRLFRFAVAAFAMALSLGACLPREQTTPLGYVIAPSSSSVDAGASADSGASDGGRSDSDSGRRDYSRAASESDARR